MPKKKTTAKKAVKETAKQKAKTLKQLHESLDKAMELDKQIILISGFKGEGKDTEPTIGHGRCISNVVVLATTIDAYLEEHPEVKSILKMKWMLG